MRGLYHVCAAVAVVAAASAVSAAPVQVRVTIENLSGANGVALSPFTVEAHDGTFDQFNNGTSAGPGTQNIAESGNGSVQLGAFAASFPNGVSGVIAASTNAFGPGIYLPGGTGSMVLVLDPAVNKFFSFGAMVVPSNDRFLGNDSPTGVRLFDDGGQFVGQTLTLMGSSIWDAGTEVDGVFGAAFLAGQDGAQHTAQNGLIGFNTDFSAYAGLATAAGYDFTGAPSSGTPVARISFTVVPEPGTLGLMALSLAVFLSRRRGRRAAV